MDETYIKVKGVWKYLYRAVDKQGKTVDFLLTAKRFFDKAMGANGNPDKVAMNKSVSIVRLAATLHPTAAGRNYAAYRGMYIAVALMWLRFVDGVQLSRWDITGGLIALVGMSVIDLQPRV
jgi:Uncharacterised BCR, YnfA/UPF0060 family/DDE domain